MKTLDKIKKKHYEYLEEQKRIAECSTDPVQKEIAQHIHDILSGKETVESLENKEIQRWKEYLVKEKINLDEPLKCKKCGYKRYFYKEYAIKTHICPGCRSEYSIVNDDSRYKANSVSKSERICSLFIGVPLLIYTFAITYFPSIYLIIGGRHSASFIEFSGLSKIPATLALMSGTAFVLSHIIDHWDKRNNEVFYRDIRFWALLMYPVFFMVAAAVKYEYP